MQFLLRGVITLHFDQIHFYYEMLNRTTLNFRP